MEDWWAGGAEWAATAKQLANMDGTDVSIAWRTDDPQDVLITVSCEHGEVTVRATKGSTLTLDGVEWTCPAGEHWIKPR